MTTTNANLDSSMTETPIAAPMKEPGLWTRFQMQRTRLDDRLPGWAKGLLTFLGALLAALIVFGVVLLLLGKNPLQIYQLIYQKVLISPRNWSEVVVKMTPFILCALAVSIPAQLGLVNVGGEGQIYLGAITASYVAINYGTLPAPILIPLILVAGALGGAFWGGVVGAMRAYVGLNETVVSLLLSYIAALIVNFLVYGPWKDPTGLGVTYSRQFSDAAMLQPFGDTRITAGIFFALAALGLYFWFFKFTRWGYKMRVIGGNPEAARRSGISVRAYLIVAMMLGGSMAGIAGMIEVTAIQGRLRPGISNGYGYVGFLVAWLAMQKAGRIAFMAALLGVIAVAGDVLQLRQIPSSGSNILMALILFFVLSNQGKKRSTEIKAAAKVEAKPAVQVPASLTPAPAEASEA